MPKSQIIKLSYFELKLNYHLSLNPNEISTIDSVIVNKLEVIRIIMELEELLPETEGFPTGEGIKIIRGKTLVKTGSWLKAILLVEVSDKKQIRLYGWQKNKADEWKLRQKFNISKGYSETLASILVAFHSS